MARTLCALLTITLVVVLAACSPSGTATRTRSGPNLPSAARLAEALLAADDVSSAYSRQPSVLAQGDGVVGCSVQRWTHGGQHSGRRTVTIAYEGDVTGPFIDEALVAEPASKASTDFRAIEAALRACRRLTIRPTASAIVLSLTSISFAPNTTAVRLDGTNGPLPVDGYVVLRRVDQTTMLAFMFFQAGSAASQLAYADYAKALAKADRVLLGRSGAVPPSAAPGGSPSASACVLPAGDALPAVRPTSEQSGFRGSPTLKDPCNGAILGVKIRPMTYVLVRCRFYAPEVLSANPDGWWYLIDSKPWNDSYYAVANTFWNGDMPGHLPYTHNTDFTVPKC